MPLQLPAGRRIAVNIGADFDAHSLWMGAFKLSSPSYLSRGEFGAEVGVPRLLGLFKRYGVRATFCTPTHTMATFPEAFAAVVDAGHEIAAHGCYHEHVPDLDVDSERRLMEKVVQQHLNHVGKRPRGYRSPSWDATEATMEILEDNGFEWDSSLMGRDFHPYHPRPLVLDLEEGNRFGPPSRLLELPVSWFLDDFPAAEYVAGINQGLGSTEVMFERWKDHFDYAYHEEVNSMIAITVHPQCIGRAHLFKMFERFIEYVVGQDGVWMTTLSDIYDTWVEG